MKQELGMWKEILPLDDKQLLHKEKDERKNRKQKEGKLRRQNQMLLLGMAQIKEQIFSDAGG